MFLSCTTINKRRLREQKQQQLQKAQQARNSDNTIQASTSAEEEADEWKPRRAIAKAMFAFKAEREGDLNILPDQEIQITMQNRAWFLGWYSLDGDIFEGVFPQNHVEIVL